MAPLPESNTARILVHYTSQGNEHTLQLRWNGDPNLTPAAVTTTLQNILNAIAPFRVSDWTITSIEIIQQGTNIALPFLGTVPTLTVGAQPPSTLSQATSLNFIGRSALGRRWRVQIFGVGFPSVETDFRLTTAEDATIANTVAALSPGISPNVAAIDGASITVYPYANQSVNAYWQRESRGS